MQTTTPTLPAAALIDHVERAVTPHPFSTPDLLVHNRQALLRALRELGPRWVGHPARRVQRLAQPRVV